MTTENVIQSREVGAFWMASLLRLFELLRIAEQNDALGGRRNCQHIRERHLSGFVYEQDIQGVFCFLSRPQPRGSSGYVDFSLAKPLEDFAVVSRLRDDSRFLFFFSYFLSAQIFCLFRFAASTTLFWRLRITLWLTAVTPTRNPRRASSQIISAPT